MADFRSIMALVLAGNSYRQVVVAAGCSHRDVAAARKVIAAGGITAASLSKMSDADVRGLFPAGRVRVSGQ